MAGPCTHMEPNHRIPVQSCIDTMSWWQRAASTTHDNTTKQSLTSRRWHMSGYIYIEPPGACCIGKYLSSASWWSRSLLSPASLCTPEMHAHPSSCGQLRLDKKQIATSKCTKSTAETITSPACKLIASKQWIMPCLSFSCLTYELWLFLHLFNLESVKILEYVIILNG